MIDICRCHYGVILYGGECTCRLQVPPLGTASLRWSGMSYNGGVQNQTDLPKTDMMNQRIRTCRERERGKGNLIATST